MNWFRKYLIVAVALLVISACGGEDEETGVPTPVPPTPTTPQAPFTPAPAPELDSRLPDLTNAVALRLDDLVDLSGLKDIAKNIFPPLVGDPLVRASISGGRDTKVEGEILLAFEDAEGFWGAIVPSYKDASFRVNDVVDMIFADDDLVVRLIGAITGEELSGKIHYRIPSETDDDCKRTLVTCEIVGPVQPGAPLPELPPECNQTVDNSAQCRAFMNTTETDVKLLGTFKTKYSNWVVRE